MVPQYSTLMEEFKIKEQQNKLTNILVDTPRVINPLIYRYTEVGIM